MVPISPELTRPEDEENWVRALWRLRFLRLVDEEEPYVKRELHEKIWSVFRESIEALFGRRDDLPGVFGIERAEEGFDDVAVCHDPFAVGWFREAKGRSAVEVEALVASIEAWQHRHNLREDWIEDAVIRTLVAWTIWSECAETGEWFCFKPAFRDALSAADLQLSLTIRVQWDSVVETRAHARRRLLKEIAKAAQGVAQIDSWLDRVEEQAREAGLVDPPRPRKEEQHLRWLIRFQVAGKSYTDIARDDLPKNPAESGRKAVRDGVESAAELVGLTRRKPDRGGRPRLS